MQEAAVRTTIDTLACALGAVDLEVAQVVGRVAIALGGPPESSLVLGSRSAECDRQRAGRVSAATAVLHNGALIRALDCNDIFFRDGVGGHPSDNVAVALAFAEAGHRSGADYLKVVAIGYELYWRLRQHVFARAPGYKWDHVSTSGIVAAAMAGLLLGLSEAQLTSALAVGGAQSYALSEVREGTISMAKATANALAAQAGSVAALLAGFGLTGPPRILEGRRGLLAAIGIPRDDVILQQLVEQIGDWRILEVTMKPFAAIGTSQAAIAGILELVHRDKLHPEDVQAVEIRFPDLRVAHEQIAAADISPQTRESADHNFAFLVAAAIEDGDVGPAQFADQRWMRPSTRDLMARVGLTTDRRLNDFTRSGYPSVVSIETRSGARLIAEVVAAPGSPARPLTTAQLGDKLRRLASATTSADRLDALLKSILELPAASDVLELGRLMAGAPGEPRSYD